MNQGFVLDGLALKALSGHFNRSLAGSRLQKIKQCSQALFLFKFYPQPDALIISLYPGWNLITLGNFSLESPQNPYAFQMLLRKHLTNSVFQAASQPGLERIMVLEFSGEGIETYRLTARLFGTAEANLTLSKGNLILGDLKNEETPGAELNIVSQNKIDPFTAGTPLLSDTKEIVRKFQGFSKKRAEEFSASGLDLQAFLANAVSDPAAVNQRIFAEFASLADSFLIDQIRQPALKKLSAKITGLEKNIQNLEKAGSACLTHGEWEKKGNLLLTSQSKNVKLREVTVIDWENGSEILIPLNPRFTVIDNAGIFFHKSKKLKQDLIRLSALLAACGETRTELLKLRESLLNSRDLGELTELAASTEILLHREKKQKPEPVEKNSNPHYFSLQSPGGHEVLIARNSGGSEVLTFQVARPFDIFLHAQDSPGAHTILRLKYRDEEISEEELYYAACEAAKHSRLKNAGRAAVSIAKVSDVRRAPGPYKGTVLLRKMKSILVKF
ncbi:MAG: NFACT family protein [Candidatus Wallbacteria bacterium]|nr:NFACT family protein [Candidatus Wallbacteria bacterium]